MSSSDFMQEARQRGFIFQCTDEDALAQLTAREKISGYIGFDCTADSLHVGSLVQIMLLRLMQRHGHRPIVLLGGGTTRVGDPSGKDEARQMLDDAKIQANMDGIARVFDAFLRFGLEASDAKLVNNADWLDKLGYIEMLREVGPHFSVNRMLSFDSVKLRLDREQPLSFLEFNYLILQSYDFRELFRREGTRLQMGGSDQWGNIISGVELVRRTDQQNVFGLTTPLITSASGAKMGKTARGAIWLSADKLPVFDYWQFWRNTKDADLGRFMRLFTDMPLAEIERLEKLGGAEINEAKKLLATEATALAHGVPAAAAAAEAARVAFEEQGQATNLPGITLPPSALKDGAPLFRLLVDVGLVASAGEARRLVRGGGARVNGNAIADEAFLVTLDQAIDGGITLSSGKKHHRMIRISDE